MKAWIVITTCAVISHAVADDKSKLAAQAKAFDQILSPASLDDALPIADKAFVVTPGHFGDGDPTIWRMGPPYLGTTKVKAKVVGGTGSWGWVAADVAIDQRPYSDSSGAMARSSTHRYHVTAVFAQGKARAIVIADTRADTKLVAGSPAKSTGAGPLAQLLAKPASIKLAADPGVAVLGSSDAELGLGGAAASKLLASWKNLKLSLVGKAYELIDGDLGIAASEVDLELKGKPVRLRGFVVARKVGADWQVVVLQYGADSEFGDPKR